MEDKVFQSDGEPGEILCFQSVDHGIKIRSIDGVDGFLASVHPAQGISPKKLAQQFGVNGSYRLIGSVPGNQVQYEI